MDAIGALRKIADAKRRIVREEIDHTRVESQEVEEQNEEDDDTMAKLVSRLAAMEKQLDDARPHALATVLAKSIEARQTRRELRIAEAALQLETAKLAEQKDAMRKVEQIARAVSEQIKGVDHAVETRTEEVRSLDSRVAAARAEKQQKREELARRMGSVSRESHGVEESQQQEHALEHALHSSLHRLRLSAQLRLPHAEESSMQSTVQRLESSLSSSNRQVATRLRKVKRGVAAVKETQTALLDAQQELVALLRKLDAAHRALVSYHVTAVDCDCTRTCFCSCRLVFLHFSPRRPRYPHDHVCSGV